MSYLVEILAENRLTDWRPFKKLKPAEDLYFRGFAAVVQQLPVRRADGELIRLIGCSLYQVPTMDLASATRIVRLNEARRLQSSEDCSGVPVEIDLFRGDQLRCGATNFMPNLQARHARNRNH